MLSLLFTCEHSTAHVPRKYAHLFKDNLSVLKTHRAYDIGALELAKKFRNRFHAPLFTGKITRLLVDLNRDLKSRTLFTEFSEALSENERSRLLDLYHAPHHDRCKQWVASRLNHGRKVIHIGVHSFTPVLNGHNRETDIGLLYDPSRSLETAFCSAWVETWRDMESGFRIRKNYPYLGKNSGLVSVLRKQFSARKYLGIELEINQKFFQQKLYINRQRELEKILINSLSKVLENFT